MTKYLTLIIVLFVSCTNSKELNELEDIFNKYNQIPSPGFSALVVKNGKIVFQNSYGLANLEKNIKIDSTTLFDIASLTKAFTAYSLLILSDRNKVNLNDSIKKHFPQLPDLFNKVSIKSLIFHTSSLTGNHPKNLCKIDQFKSFSPNYQVIEWIVKSNKSNYLSNAPIGSAHKYSNIGYVLLGSLVEKLSGTPYKNFVKKEIFQKIGIENALILRGNEASEIDTVSYDRWPEFKVGKNRECLMPVGEGGIIMNSKDMAKWLKELQKKTLLSKKSKSRLFRKGHLYSGKEIDYGYGFQFYNNNGSPIIFHTGHWKHYTSMILLDPNKGISVGILSNYEDISLLDKSNFLYSKFK